MAMMYFIIILSYMVIAGAYGFWGGYIIRKIHRERPDLYSIIKGDLPNTFIERGYFSPDDKGLDRRMLKVIYSREHPEIFDPKWLPLFSLMRCIVWIGVVVFIVACLLVALTFLGLI